MRTQPVCLAVLGDRAREIVVAQRRDPSANAPPVINARSDLGESGIGFGIPADPGVDLGQILIEIHAIRAQGALVETRQRGSRALQIRDHPGPVTTLGGV